MGMNEFTIDCRNMTCGDIASRGGGSLYKPTSGYTSRLLTEC